MDADDFAAVALALLLLDFFLKSFFSCVVFFTFFQSRDTFVFYFLGRILFSLSVAHFPIIIWRLT